MLRSCYVLCGIGFLLLPCSVGNGAFVEFGCEDLWNYPLSTDIWSFDFDTQTLTLTELRTEVPSDPLRLDPLNFIRPGGRLDGSQVDTFTISSSIANQSPVAWTGLIVSFSTAHGTSAKLVDGSALSSVFSDVTGYGPVESTLVFSGGGVVLPGETLAIQFDVWVDGRHSFGGFSVMLNSNPVPEPGSILMLACGAAMLLPRHSRRATGARKWPRQ